MAMLDIKHLTTEFTTENGVVRAVRDVSLHVEKGEVLGIVGESGSGKSQTMFSVMGLLAQNGKITNGSIQIDGEEISPAVITEKKEYEAKMDRIRGNDMAMIFQDPMTFLNPVLRIQTQLIEPMHQPQPGHLQEGGDRSGDRTDAQGRHSFTGNADPSVSVPVLRRYAPAYHHRDRSGV